VQPAFLELVEVLAIHRDQIERYGGTPGIRDMALLQSAVATPSAGVAGRYLHEDLYEMAVAYLLHIVRDHPFLDGNKRTGVVAAIVFLALDGVELDADQRSLERLVRGVAEGTASKAAVADYVRKHAAK
jgi:death-on-curing protein